MLQHSMADRKAELEEALAKLDEQERVQILTIVSKDEIIQVRHQLHIM